MKKKLLALILSVAVVASIAAAGTLAYLTASADPVVNTFTVGNIEIDLEEHKLLEDGKLDPSVTVPMNEYKRVLPGAELNKDPFVTVKAGSEDCYLYVQVIDGINAAVPGAATTDMDVRTAENPDGKWIAVDEANGIYRYAEVVAHDATNNQAFTVFNKVNFAGTLTNEQMKTLDKGIIAIKAFAIQEDNNTVDTANTEATTHFMASKA